MNVGNRLKSYWIFVSGISVLISINKLYGETKKQEDVPSGYLEQILLPWCSVEIVSCDAW